MADITVSLDCIKRQKHRKTTNYNGKLTKLVNKAKKFKTGKESYEVKSNGQQMNFTSKGKKASPINQIDCTKIQDLKKSPADKTIGFAYPKSDKKTPIMLYSMRFKSDVDYNKFVKKIETEPIEYRNPENRPPSSLRPSSNDDAAGIKKQGESTAWGTGENVREETGMYSPTESKQPASMLSSTSRSKRRSRNPEMVSFISTDNLYSPNPRRGRTPVIRVKSPFETSYICTRSTIRESPPSPYRAYSAGPQSRHNSIRVRKIYQVSRSSSYGSDSYSSSTSSSDSLSSTSLSDYASKRAGRRCRRFSFSESSSDDSSSDSGPELFSQNISGGRSFIISRCSKSRRSGIRCRPVGKLIVTPDTPSFVYEA